MTELFDLERLGSIKDLTSNTELSPNKFFHAIVARRKNLQTEGLRAGNVVALLNNNTLEFFIDFFAIMNLEAIPFPISDSVKNKNQIFGSVGVSFFITADKILHRFQEYEAPQVTADCKLLLLSSGTSGRSKAVCLSEKLLVDRVKAIQKMQSTNTEVALCLMATSFGHGLIANCLSFLTQQKRLVLIKDFDLSLSFKLNQIIVTEGINFISSVPTHFEFFRRAGLKILGPQADTFEMHCASAPLRPKTYGYMRDILGDAKIKYHYGMTELGSWMTQTELPTDPTQFEFGLVGNPYGTSFVCENSELFIDSCLSEIRTIDIETAETTITDKGSKFNTGDLGHIKNGCLFLTGRIGDFINKAGYKISPHDIENTIVNHPDVEECVVFAVDDLIYGEQIAALIAVKIVDAKTEAGIKRFCYENLLSLNFPKYFYFASNIPKNFNGKVSRKYLSEFYSKNQSEKV